jgi:Uma2 family endonuclease
MATATAKRSVTFEEFCLLVKDGQQVDLIDGVIYMASPDNTDANRIETWLICLLREYIFEKELGDIFHSRVAFQLSEDSAPEPDIAVAKKGPARPRQTGARQRPTRFGR